MLRRTRPDAERPYRAIGYPVLPAIYIVMALFIDVVLLRYKPQYTWPGLIIVLLGIPVYYLWSLRRKPSAMNRSRHKGERVHGESAGNQILNTMLPEAEETGEHSLKRTLGPVNLVMLGIGAIIGAGCSCGPRPLRRSCGASVMLAFIVAGFGCAFAGLCYAEFASMIPVAGSAYTYSYATMGEFVAWIIGWDLILEYAVGAATVAIAWSEYFNRVLDWFGMRIPYHGVTLPLEHMDAAHGIIVLPAVLILFLLSALLMRGTKESAMVNGFIVVLKVLSCCW